MFFDKEVLSVDFIWRKVINCIVIRWDCVKQKTDGNNNWIDESMKIRSVALKSVLWILDRKQRVKRERGCILL